ncbi:hypothetical protein GQ53DRAFT_343201 [Thozetella sp. PMI_491]|nr:hypothetical protein GQ53DRAFT_343201 [Thozetella sp. PMI_491]
MPHPLTKWCREAGGGGHKTKRHIPVVVARMFFWLGCVPQRPSCGNPNEGRPGPCAQLLRDLDCQFGAEHCTKCLRGRAARVLRCCSRLQEPCRARICCRSLPGGKRRGIPQNIQSRLYTKLTSAAIAEVRHAIRTATWVADDFFFDFLFQAVSGAQIWMSGWMGGVSPSHAPPASFDPCSQGSFSASRADVYILCRRVGGVASKNPMGSGSF